MKNSLDDTYVLRRLIPAEWENYRSIRLEALKTNPEMFGSNFIKEEAYSRDNWIAFLENEARAMFALYQGETLVGLSGATLKKDNPATALFFASFINPGHRGNGLSKLFYEARIDWAKSKNCQSIVVSHRDGNELSKAAILRYGFAFTHAEEVAWPDRKNADELAYSLQL